MNGPHTKRKQKQKEKNKHCIIQSPYPNIYYYYYYYYYYYNYNNNIGFDLNKAQFWDAIKLRCDWEITDLPSVCDCGEAFSVDHAMICRRGGFVIQRHNELRDLEAVMLDMVCYDVEVEPVLQVLTGETLERGANTAPDTRLDIHARGVWERQRSAFFDVRVFHPNADS